MYYHRVRNYCEDCVAFKYTTQSTIDSSWKDGGCGAHTVRDFTVLSRNRYCMEKGADVASADEVTLGMDGDYFDITGTTEINHITETGWQAGSVMMLQFDASVTVKHNTASTPPEAPILLSGAGDFSATAGDTLQLVYDGAAWREVSRTVI